MDYEIPLEITFDKYYYKRQNTLLGFIDKTVEVINYNNDHFILKIKDINHVMRVNDFSHIQFLILYQAYQNYTNKKNIEKSQHIKLINLEICIKIKGTSHYNKYPKLCFKATLNSDLIEFNLSNPLIKLWFDFYYNNFVTNTFSTKPVDIENTSFLPDADIYEIQTKNKNLTLYNYQKRTIKKMIEIENRISNEGNCKVNHNIKFGSCNYVVNPVNSEINSNDMNLTITTRGGILADEMGLGKTITTLSLIKANTNKDDTYKYIKFDNSTNKILTNCSLIICPNHLAKQWTTEVKKAYPSLKVIVILNKIHHNKTSYYDFVNADIIIVTQQFLMNFKHYPTIEYMRVTPATLNLSSRHNIIKNKFNEWKNKFINDKDIYNKIHNPLFEAFKFERIIIDEGHEIFGEMANKNQSLSYYIAELLNYFDGKNFWLVSGTPFSNNIGFVNAMKFIKTKVTINNIEHDFDTNLTNNFKFFNNDTLRKRLLANCMIRHRKDDIGTEIELPGYDETIIWVEQTDMEKSLYQSKIGKTSRTVLQQLCCHPLIAESFNRLIKNKEVDLDSMKDTIISHNESMITIYSKKLEQLDPHALQYHMLKASFSKKVSEARYLLTIMKKMTSNEIDKDETCSICFDTLEDPTLTPCGHLFCNECLLMCLKAKQSCPMCKADLKDKALLKINGKKINKDKIKNPLIEKYGAKLGKLICVIRHLTNNKDNRIIVFSQWDNMLRLLARTLSENGVGNSIVKGNVWARNSAISKFKNGVNKVGDENKVIMLSLNNAASGTNLTEASHIFFIEPIDATKREIEAIEGQAIGRACRIGQKNKVNIVRIVTKNTIEEEIFNKLYKNNTFIPVDKVINQPIEFDI